MTVFVAIVAALSIAWTAHTLTTTAQGWDAVLALGVWLVASAFVLGILELLRLNRSQP